MGFVDKKVHYLSRKLQAVARAPTYDSVVRGGPGDPVLEEGCGGWLWSGMSD